MYIVQGEWVIKKRNCAATLKNRRNHNGQAIDNRRLFLFLQGFNEVATCLNIFNRFTIVHSRICVNLIWGKILIIQHKKITFPLSSINVKIKSKNIKQRIKYEFSLLKLFFNFSFTHSHVTLWS